MRPPSGEILQNEYRQRVSQVMDYIHHNYGEDLSLDKLAQMACLSKYHFHRVFKSVAGEPPGDFIRRVRVRESMGKLVFEPHKSITSIALECGFSSSQNFTKMFKAYRGLSPSDVRKDGCWKTFCEKIDQMRGKRREELRPDEMIIYDMYRKSHVELSDLLQPSPLTDVEIKKLPDFQVAYIRNIGSIRSDVDANLKRLFEWAVPRGLWTEDPKMLVMSRSNAQITPEDKRILDACIIVPESVRPDQWVNVQKITGGAYAVHRCEIEHNNTANLVAWLNVMFNWIVPSIYQLDARPNFQRILNNPHAHPDKHLIMDIHIAVKPVYE